MHANEAPAESVLFSHCIWLSDRNANTKKSSKSMALFEHRKFNYHMHCEATAPFMVGNRKNNIVFRKARGELRDVSPKNFPE